MDIVRFPDWREKCVYEPLVFVLLWFKSTLPSQERAFQKRSSCHFRTGQRRNPAPTNLNSQPAMSCTFGSVHVWRCTKCGTWTGAVERAWGKEKKRLFFVRYSLASQSTMQAANSRSAIRDFLSETIATHPRIIQNALRLGKKNGELVRCSLTSHMRCFHKQPKYMWPMCYDKWGVFKNNQIVCGLYVATYGEFSRLAPPLQHQRTLFNGEMQIVNRPRKEGPSKNVMPLSQGRMWCS